MQNTRRLDPEPLHAFTHSLRSWVLSLAVWLAETFGHLLPRDWRIELRHGLRDALSQVRGLVVLLALARASIPIAPKRIMRPSSTPRGFRRARRHGSDMRCFKRLVRVRARSIAGRLAELRDVLGNLGKWTARVIARLAQFADGAALVAVSPPACVFVGRSAPACVGADTS